MMVKEHMLNNQRVEENSLDFIGHAGIVLQQAVAFQTSTARKVADMPFVSLARPV